MKQASRDLALCGVLCALAVAIMAMGTILPAATYCAPVLASMTLLLGPSPAPVARVNYTYRYRLTLSCKNSRKLRQLLSQHLRMFFTEKENKGVSAFADVNSYD